MTTTGCQPRRRGDAPVESYDYASFMRRALKAFARRGASDIDALVLLRDLVTEAQDALDEAARGAHEHWSWGEIAARLGVSRQAARQRWGSSDPADRSSPAAAE